jgi:hypothetical protein
MSANSNVAVDRTHTLIDSLSFVPDLRLSEKIEEDVGGPTWTRTCTKRKNALASKPERFLSFSAERTRGVKLTHPETSLLNLQTALEK